MKLLPFLAVPLLLGSCALPGETDPFRAQQQWQVTGHDGETRLDVVVGTGWLPSTSSQPKDAPAYPLPGDPPPRSTSVYTNKNVGLGVVTALFKADATPTLILDPTLREGTVLWNAGRAGDFYICRFGLTRGQQRLAGKLFKHVQVKDIAVGTCILELK